MQRHASRHVVVSGKPQDNILVT